MFVAMSIWAISSPPGSSPDEDYHLVSIWCSLGTREGLCAPGSTEGTRVVPTDLLAAPCFAFKPEAAGDCPYYPGETIETGRGNFAGYYPNGFYSLMGLLAGPSLAWSVIVMRLLNSAVYAAAFGALLYFSSPGRRSNYILGSLVTLVPLGIFTVASINPSSWAITSATVLWAAVVEFARATQRHNRIGLGVIAVVACLLALSSRADAAAYAGLAICLAWLATVRFGRRSLIFGGIAAAIGLAVIVWSQSLGSASGALSGEQPVRPDDYKGGWFQRLQDLPGFYVGVFGTRGLGWLDTSLRSATWVLAGGACVAAVFWGLRRSSWRKTVALTVILVVASVAPLVLSTLRNAWLTETLQPRYFLPLVILAVMIAISEDNPDGPGFHPLQAVALVLALGIAHGNALHTNLRRYLTGIDKKWFNLNRDIEWWWSWAPSPMAVFAIGTLCFVAAAATAALVQHYVVPTVAKRAIQA